MFLMLNQFLDLPFSSRPYEIMALSRGQLFKLIYHQALSNVFDQRCLAVLT